MASSVAAGRESGVRTERRKGAAGEREAIALIREAGWPHARRTSDGRGQAGRGDIAGGPAGCHIEVKRQERLNVPAALSQVRADADPLDVPILVHRPSRAPWMATVPLSDLLALLALRER
jgi:hypothetical protein